MRKCLILSILFVALGCEKYSGLEGYHFISDDSDSDIGTASSEIVTTGSDTTTDSSITDTTNGSETDTNISVDTSGDSDSQIDSGTFSDTQDDPDTTVQCTVTNGGVELCDGIDNNCDGNTDESFDFTSDPQNCGGCENDCMTTPELWGEFGGQMPAHVKSATCINGHCQVAECDLGHVDDPVFPYPDCRIFVERVSAGRFYTCTSLSDSTVQCWGDNASKQLGRDTGDEIFDIVPKSVAGLSMKGGVTVATLATGSSHACILLSDSTIQCWGYNAEGQLGRDTGDENFNLDPKPVMGLSLDDGVTVAALSAGASYTCALLSDSTVECWGGNFNGELGRSTGDKHADLEPKPVEGLDLQGGVTIVALSAGNNHTCVLLSDNIVECWGSNYNGALGRDTGDEIVGLNPKPVEGLYLRGGATVAALSAGSYHTCAMLSDSTVECWGLNTTGQLGRDTGDENFVIMPKPVVGLSLDAGVTVAALAAGENHTCALLSDSTIQCWGSNYNGELGRDTGDGTFDIDPKPVVGLSLNDGVAVVALSAGSYHTCALLSDSTIQCWGNNAYGQLGRDAGNDFGDHIPYKPDTGDDFSNRNPEPVEGLSLGTP
ncbi:MAG: hypothetical protein JXR76_02180 [Deltaproteobacteria bacterium]|nr:hypothetical protein [Deltaproteobacteria bacterium]